MADAKLAHLALVFGILLASCGEIPQGTKGNPGDTEDAPRSHSPRDHSRQNAWHHTDLIDQPPSRGDARTTIALTSRGVERPGRQIASEVQALETAVGTSLEWTLELGRTPLLNYVPLSPSPPGCDLTYRVEAGPVGGPLETLLAEPAPISGFHPPATVELELGPGLDARTAPATRRRARLRLTVDAVGDCADVRAAWGVPAVWHRRPAPRPPGTAERPNVVLIGLDTVRADALGVYGREPSPTPAIDRLGAESDVYLDAFASFNITNPSFASILTGLYGKNHGVYDLSSPLPEEMTTLAEIFRAAGYATGAVLSVAHLKEEWSGLDQGFDVYTRPRGQLAAEQTIGDAIDWIAGRERPFFLWLHLFDPHTPHTVPRPYAEGLRPAETGVEPARSWVPLKSPGEPPELRRPSLGGHEDLYLAELAYLDHQIGRFLDVLESRGLLNHTIVALVADHGENLGEHGVYFQHSGLWDATVHVPLMIRWPDASIEAGASRGRRIPGFVQTIDLFPTLLTAAGLEAPPSDGLDLSRSDRGRRLVFAESSRGKGAMVRTADHLLFLANEQQGLVDPGSYLFDLQQDPGQTKNLAGQGLAAEAELRRILDAWLAERRTATAPPVALSEDERDDLRALGYVD